MTRFSVGTASRGRFKFNVKDDEATLPLYSPNLSAAQRLYTSLIECGVELELPVQVLIYGLHLPYPLEVLHVG